jgi:hypothetical protein
MVTLLLFKHNLPRASGPGRPSPAVGLAPRVPLPARPSAPRGEQRR